jgi:aldehyde dehydrogenase (NAD+)
VIPCDDEEEAVTIVNDTSYGPQAYVEKADVAAWRVAERLESGRVAINGAPHGPLAPAFGGFKQSGIGREYSRSGLKAHLEARAILG